MNLSCAQLENLSLNDKSSLFAPCSAHKMSPRHFLCFRSPASSKAASWSTYPSMSYEAALKSAKKHIKNQRFIIKE
jgi:hypothetical protein